MALTLIQISQKQLCPFREQEIEVQRTVTHPGSKCTGGRASLNPSPSPGYCLTCDWQASSAGKGWVSKSARAMSSPSKPAPSLSTRVSPGTFHSRY